MLYAIKGYNRSEKFFKKKTKKGLTNRSCYYIILSMVPGENGIRMEQQVSKEAQSRDIEKSNCRISLYRVNGP
jgi:hypothetical protein